MTQTIGTIDRRKLLMGSAGVATIGVAGSIIYTLLRAPPRAEVGARRPRRPTQKVANVSQEELLKAGALPDLVIGNADAPVTIVEYASMTCNHCANFHNTVLPALKEKYIDTGKVRLVFREFPLDERAALASMMARCAGDDKSMPLISMLFAKQDEWASAKQDFLPKLFRFGQQVGVTKTVFDRCRQDEKLLKSLIAVRDRGNASFGVSSTPTFFINGKRFEGGSVEEFEKVLAPLVKS